MKSIMAPLLPLLLTACATTSPGPGVSLHAGSRLSAIVAPIQSTPSLQQLFRPEDAVTLIDSRSILALHRARGVARGLQLTDEQRLAVIIGASIVGVYLINEWLEDNLPLPPGP